MMKTFSWTLVEVGNRNQYTYIEAVTEKEDIRPLSNLKVHTSFSVLLINMLFLLGLIMPASEWFVYVSLTQQFFFLWSAAIQLSFLTSVFIDCRWVAMGAHAPYISSAIKWGIPSISCGFSTILNATQGFLSKSTWWLTYEEADFYVFVSASVVSFVGYFGLFLALKVPSKDERLNQRTHYILKNRLGLIIRSYSILVCLQLLVVVSIIFINDRNDITESLFMMTSVILALSLLVSYVLWNENHVCHCAILSTEDNELKRTNTVSTEEV